MAYRFIGGRDYGSLTASKEAIRRSMNEPLSQFTSRKSSKLKYPPLLKRNPIDWDIEKGMKVASIFEELQYPFRNHLDSLLIEGFERELQLFAISLDAYIESGYNMDIKKIIYLSSIGPEGSKILKNCRKLLFLRKIEAIAFEDSEINPLEEDLIKDLPLDDIDQVFNYRYLPLWREDVNDFLENSYIKVEQTQEYLDNFRETLRELLSGIKVSSEDCRLDISLTSSRSISLENSKKIRNFERVQKQLHEFNDQINEVERTIIPVAPQCFRDAVIVDWRSLNTVRFIEYRVTKILAFLPYQVYTDKNEQYTYTVKNFYKRDYTYICRDLRKEGLTKPRNLLKIMLEELSKIDKSLEPYQNFFENYSVKGFEKPDRGHGQGMANALTTLMQVVLTQMIANIGVGMGLDFDVNALSYNDDNVTRIPSDLVDTYWEIEGEVMKNLGLIRADSKSFYSNQGFIICETYVSPFYPSCNLKQTVSRRIMLYSLLYDFPYEVKNYLSGVSNNKYFSEYITEIIDNFGYEFFPEEIQYPLSIGGWMPDKIGDLYTATIDLYDLDFDLRVIRMYHANNKQKIRIPIDRQRMKHSMSIYDHLFGKAYRKEISSYLPAGDFKDLYFIYGLYREDSKHDWIYRSNLHKSRQEIFKRKQFDIISFEDFIDLLLSKGNYLFPRNRLEFSTPTQYVLNIDRDPYVQDTPIENFLSYLGVIDPIRSPYRECYSIKRSIKPLDVRKNEIPSWTPEIENSQFKGIPFSEESFYSIDPVVDDTAAFLYAHFQVYGSLPVLKASYPENTRKKEVFNQFLSLDEYIEYSNLKYDRWDYLFFKKFSEIYERSQISSEELSSIIQSIIDERKEESDTSSFYSDDLDEEEEERIRNLYKINTSNKLPLTSDDLPNILLGYKQADLYDKGNFLSKFVYPVMRFYNHHDSVGGDKIQKLKDAFEEFLQDDELKDLLISANKDGYLVEIGEALGIFIPDDSFEDISGFFNEES